MGNPLLIGSLLAALAAPGAPASKGELVVVAVDAAGAVTGFLYRQGGQTQTSKHLPTG